MRRTHLAGVFAGANDENDGSFIMPSRGNISGQSKWLPLCLRGVCRRPFSSNILISLSQHYCALTDFLKVRLPVQTGF
jgi:hypothetical protein